MPVTIDKNIWTTDPVLLRIVAHCYRPYKDDVSAKRHSDAPRSGRMADGASMAAHPSSSLSLFFSLSPPFLSRVQERKKYKKTEADLLKRYNLAFTKDIIKQSAAIVAAESGKPEDGYNSGDERQRLISRYPAAAIPAPIPVIPTSSSHSLPHPFPYGSLGSLLPPSMYGGPPIDFSNFPSPSSLAAAAAAAPPIVSSNFEPTFLGHLNDISTSLKRIASVLEGSRAVASAVKGSLSGGGDMELDHSEHHSGLSKKRKAKEDDDEEEESETDSSPAKRQMMDATREGDNASNNQEKYHSSNDAAAAANKKK